MLDLASTRLEEVVQGTYKAGMAYVQARHEAERNELMKPVIKAQIMHRLDDGKLSEVKLKRLAERDPEFVEFIEKLATSKAECERLRIRYEAYKNLFEARRSQISYQKAEMRFL